MSCDGCGAETSPDNPQPFRCGECPPEECPECGDINHLATDRLCRCWTPLRDFTIADLKALFAADGLSIGTDGRITR